METRHCGSLHATYNKGRQGYEAPQGKQGEEGERAVNPRRECGIGRLVLGLGPVGIGSGAAGARRRGT